MCNCKCNFASVHQTTSARFNNSVSELRLRSDSERREGVRKDKPTFVDFAESFTLVDVNAAAGDDFAPHAVWRCIFGTRIQL